MNQFLCLLNEHRENVVKLREAEQLRELVGSNTISTPLLRELHERFAETEPGALTVIEKADDPLTRSVLVLRFIEGLEWRDVALQLGGSNRTGCVKMICYRFLGTLEKQTPLRGGNGEARAVQNET